MRFSAITALCAAPLALAGTLHAELVARGVVGVEAGVQVSRSDAMSGSGEPGNSKSSYNSDDYEGSSSYNNGDSSSYNNGGSSSYNNGDNYDNNGNNAIVQQSNSVTEVIVIWVNYGGNSATTVVNTAQAIASATAAAATHSVVVGGSAGFVYTPDTIEAAVGDMVIFTFMSNNHTATQSAFTTPCERLTGGFDSGFMPNINNTVSPAPQMAMQVTVATPIWFYCRQTGHCGKGMTFSINPTANKTQAMFEQMAIAQNGTGTASAITGGTTTTAAAPPSAATSSSASSGTMVSGTGSYNTDGSCECSCLCGVAAYPNAAIQGIGGYGGLSGAIPMSALES